MENNQCPFYGTRVCAMLHMETCEQCKNNVADKAAVSATQELVDTYLDKLPPEPPALLFEGDTCTLCKGTPEQKDGYGIYTFGHPEPKTVIKHLIIKRQASAGMLLPLQFSICKKCRMRLLLIDYLPLMVTVLLGAASLLVISRPAVSDRLNAVNELLPLGIWALCVLVGYGLGVLGRRVLTARFEKKMYLNILEHPYVKELLARGWFPVPQDKAPKAVFTKKRLDAGLGTAPSEAYGANSSLEEEVPAEDTPQA